MNYPYGAQSSSCPGGALSKPHAVVTAGTNTYCYDANGNQVRRTIGGSVYNLLYDAENRLSSVSGAATAGYVYDGDGKRVKETNAYKNLAQGIVVSGSVAVTNPDVITNGDTQADSGAGTSREFGYSSVNGLQYVQIDLGGLFPVNKVSVWHYNGGTRTYHNTKTQVSADGVTWTTVFDSAVSGEYVETLAGKTHTFTQRSVRYVRDYLNGSTANSGNHWTEIEVWGTATTAYVGDYFEWNGSPQTMTRYYSAGGVRVALRNSNGYGTDGLVYLLGDHLGSTSLTADPVDGDKLSELRYKAWGETRHSLTNAPTDRRYTGQAEEVGIGLYYYGARFYDPALGRFASPDSIIPGVGVGGNPNAVGHDSKSIYSPLIVDYHENQLLNQLNSGTKAALKDSDNRSFPVPTNSIAFDRYGYSLNNPVRYVDPTGHEPAPPPDVKDFLKQLERVKIIWRDAPRWAQGLFEKTGRRIVTIDHPHGKTDFWHLNTDIKPLQWLNHKNIENCATKLLAAKSAIESIANFASDAGIQLLERSPIPLLFWPSEIPSGVIHPKT